MSERIERFSRGMRQGQKALVAYFTAGFPTLAESRQVFAALAASGADCLEIGVPFSDPLADGPTIQRASETALRSGGGLRQTLDVLAALRSDNLDVPCIVFGYYNPVYRMGLENFAAAAAGCGADAALVPDLPLEEAAPLEAAMQQHGLGLVHLVAPTSTPERMRRAHSRSHGFVYAVSVTGVTGAREALPADLADFVRAAKAAGRLPVVVGFGVRDGAQARAVAAVADGVVVGSAFIEAARSGGSEAVARLAGELKRALSP